MPEAVNGAATSNGTPAPNGANANGQQPVNTESALDELLNKSGGLKFKAGNREHVVKNRQALLQALGEGVTLRERASQALTEAQKAKQDAQRWESIKQAPKEQRWKQLADLLGEDVLNESAHAYFSEAAQREAQAKQLTPREREAMERAEAAERRARQVAEEAEKLKRSQSEAQAQAEYRQRLEQYDAVLGEALQDSGATPEMAPYLVPALGAYIDEATKLGLTIEPKALAQEAFNAQLNIARNVISRLSPRAVLAMLEEVRLNGEDGKPGRSLYYHTMVEWNRKRTAPPGDGDGVKPTPPAERPRDNTGRFTAEQKQDLRASLRSILSAKPRLTRGNE